MNETDFSDITRLSDKFNKDPKSRIFVQLADVYRKNNMIEEALDVLNKGLQHHSQYPVAYLILGKCYYDKRAYVQAKDAFEKTIDLDPQNIVALRMLAKTSEILKDEKGQIHAYKRIVSIDPMDTTAQEKLSMLEALQRKEPLYTVAMAEEYEKQGNLKEALKIYENLLFTDPSDLVLNQRVAALKKTINEEKRRIEEEKIEGLQIERVFKTEELPAEELPTEEPAEKAETPSVSDTSAEEKPPTVQNDIQSLEDFLVEELEQAAEKVAAQPTEEEREPKEEETRREGAPIPLLDVQPEPEAPVTDVTEELPEPVPPKPETMPPEIELATFEPKPEPTPAEPVSAEPEPETALPVDEIREPILPETTSPEPETEKPLPIGEATEPGPTVTTPPETEEEPVAPDEETPPHIIETTEPAEEIVPATPPEPEVTKETTTTGAEVEPPDKTQPPEPERESEKKEEPTKTKEEDFKSFQEWLSGLLK